MAPTKYLDRDIPKISMRDFPNRIDQITAQLVDASENIGFFVVVDHGISLDEINSVFSLSESFFSLPESAKETVPWGAQNAGWEKQAQIRPSTAMPDQKESYQLQFSQDHMNGLWISDDILPGFEAQAKKFMNHAQEVSEQLMLCLARGLGFEDDFFIRAHNVKKPNTQTVMRLLHYFAMPEQYSSDTYYRAGAHTDWSFLTLLFQKSGQSGLEICPGREAVTDFGIGDTWTKVEPAEGEIVCNIGDLLMSWSDDRFKSTFHRVRTPSDPATESFGPRYSIAFFNQPCTDARIQGPEKRYPLVTGEEFTRNAMKRNFAALEAKRREQGKTTNPGPATTAIPAGVPIAAR